jgi:hypothetical protein
MRRRRLLGLTGAALIAHACGPVVSAADPPQPHELDRVAAALLEGGQRADGIPAIDVPDYDRVDTVSDLPATVFTQHVGEYEDEDVVDALVGADGVPRAYPRWITVWHEVVNEVIAHEPIAITYCPLTGSSLVFSGRIPGTAGSTFGVSGRIFNNNLVVFDRETRSLWPQLLGIAVDGPRKGRRLEALPLAVTTTLGRWKARFPRSLVLTPLTGWRRPYRAWPYGRDYDESDRILFPVTARDGRLPAKHRVVGVARWTEEGRTAAAAIDKAAALGRGVTMFDLDRVPHVALADDGLQVLRVYRAEAGGQRLTFRNENGATVDRETGSRWSYMGIALSGPLATERLEQVTAPEVFWFAWYAAYPRTALIA